MNSYTETTIQYYSCKVVHCYYKTSHFAALANSFCPKRHAVMARADMARAVIAGEVQECWVGVLGWSSELWPLQGRIAVQKFDSEGWSCPFISQCPSLLPITCFSTISQIKATKHYNGPSQYMEQFTGLQLKCCLGSDSQKDNLFTWWLILSTLSALCSLLLRSTL